MVDLILGLALRNPFAELFELSFGELACLAHLLLIGESVESGLGGVEEPLVVRKMTVELELEFVLIRMEGVLSRLVRGALLVLLRIWT